MTSFRPTYRLSAFLACAVVLCAASSSEAFPYFARRYGVGCSTYHSVVPKLNETGETFRARGYRLERPTRRTIPFAGGFAARYESRASDGIDDAYLKVVKAVTGGPIGERASFVVKWHALDRKLNSRGRLEDHSGVFEDLFLNIDLDQDLRLTVGQFRVFNQFDASRDADRPIDGLYLHGSIPFSGEFSFPSTERAVAEVPFVVEQDPKVCFSRDITELDCGPSARRHSLIPVVRCTPECSRSTQGPGRHRWSTLRRCSTGEARGA